MLQFIFGRAGFGKTKKIHELVLETAQKNNSKLMLIVPEQKSLETEKTILESLGPQRTNKVQVMTFTRLVDLVAMEFGKIPGTRINKADRNLLMSLAISDVADKLELYSDQTEKPEFIEMMISAMSEFKMCNVSCNALQEVLTRVDESGLKSKIKESVIIFEAYEALLIKTYIDPLDDLTHLAQTLTEHDFFNGYTVFFDGFDGFTMQQLAIIEIILRQSEMCYIALCTNRIDPTNDSFELFASVNKVANRILNLAKRNFVKIKTPIYLTESQRFNNDSLRHLEAQIFRAEKHQFLRKVDNVTIFCGNSKYDEAEFICRTIKRLVQDNGYKYGDFAIVTRNEEVYRGIIDSTLEKFEIPYFMDRREEIDSKPLMRVVLMALEVLNSNFASEYIFKYLKTGLTSFHFDEIFELENYVLFWSITGQRWLTEFTSNPTGYSKMDDAAKEKLYKLNELRKKIISPLVKLRDKISDAVGESIVKALYEFLEDIGITRTLQTFCEELKAANQQELANEQVRLWSLLMDIFDRMTIILREKKMSVKRFSKLLKLAVTSYDIAFVPHGIDEVTVGTVDRARVSGVKVVFLLGAVEGEFPRTPVSTGLFSDAQRRQLISFGLPLYDSLEGLSLNERFLAYKAVTMPSEKLFITWSSATTLGGTKSASSIVRETKFLLPNVKCLDGASLRLEDEIWSKQAAFEVCARHWSDNSRFSHTLKKYFENEVDYKDKIVSIEKVTSKVPFKLNDSQKINELFGKDLTVSASQVEKFYLCKFAYFCKYGLLAKERKKAQFNALEYGNIIHFIFEKVLKKYELEQLLTFSEGDVLDAVTSILSEYVQRNLGGWTDKTHRVKYLFERVANTSVPLIQHMANELSQSKFIPRDFELELSEKSRTKPLKLNLPDGSSIAVEGKIDRVDVMQREGQSYVRVVDYKTGAKKFNLSDVLYGLNLQMLIYLEALWTNGSSKYGKIVPAGVLYLPSTLSALSLDRDENLSKLEKEKMKKLQMNGLVLDDLQVIFGMEQDAKGVYIPVVMKDDQPKSVEALATVAEMGAIMRHINKAVVDMVHSLREGDIAAQPAKGSYDACEFCEYKAVCAPVRDESSRRIERVKREEVFEKLTCNGGEKK